MMQERMSLGKQVTESGRREPDLDPLCDYVYEKVLERILGGVYPEKARLPPEVALSEELGVSRPVLRQALARLRDDNLIVSRRGSGNYVKSKPSSAMLAYAPISSILDMQRCFEFRTGLEGEFCALAAERRTGQALADIGAALDRINQKLQAGASDMDSDYRFHLAVCKASENKYFLKAFSSLYGNIRTGMQLMSSLANLNPAKRFKHIQEEHSAIFRAIEAGDSVQAREAMRTHIDNARRRMLESED